MCRPSLMECFPLSSRCPVSRKGTTPFIGYTAAIWREKAELLKLRPELLEICLPLLAVRNVFLTFCSTRILSVTAVTFLWQILKSVESPTNHLE